MVATTMHMALKNCSSGIHLDMHTLSNAEYAICSHASQSGVSHAGELAEDSHIAIFHIESTKRSNTSCARDHTIHLHDLQHHGAFGLVNFVDRQRRMLGLFSCNGAFHDLPQTRFSGFKTRRIKSGRSFFCKYKARRYNATSDNRLLLLVSSIIFEHTAVDSLR